MRFMMIVKADKQTEAGVMPTAEELEALDEYRPTGVDVLSRATRRSARRALAVVRRALKRRRV